MAQLTAPARSVTPAFPVRGLFAERDAHSRQRDLVRASLLLRPADARVGSTRRN
jgi:hypothetical protein